MSSEKIVKLDVGGTIFKTSKSTLTKFDGFFKTMLESNIPIAKDATGAIFIDRSPKHFDRILTFMRNGDIKIPESSDDVDEIQKESQYYLLDGLVELGKSGRSEEFVIRHLVNWKEETAAIVNSRKKAVAIINYHEDYPPDSVLIATLPLKHGDFMDLFFKTHSHIYNTVPRCTVYDKTNNKSFSCFLPQLEEMLKSECAHLL